MSSALKHWGRHFLSSILLQTSIMPKYNSHFQYCKLAYFYELVNIISMYFIAGTTDVFIFSQSLWNAEYRRTWSSLLNRPISRGEIYYIYLLFNLMLMFIIYYTPIIIVQSLIHCWTQHLLITCHVLAIIELFVSFEFTYIHSIRKRSITVHGIVWKNRL